MSGLNGGSAWAFARDVAEGHLLVTERLARRLTRPEFDRVQFEIDRRLREIRCGQPARDDVEALRLRNRKLQRLRSCQVVLRSYRLGRKH